MTKLPGWLLGVLIAALFVIAGGLGYAFSTGQWDRSDTSDPSGVSSDPVRRVNTDSDTPTVLEPRRPAAPADIETPAPDDKDEDDSGPTPLRYLGWDTRETDPDQPQACLNLTAKPDPARVIADKAFVRVQPETPFSLAAFDRQLCVLGLDPGTTYAVQLLDGFTSLDGSVLQGTVTETVSFDPKPGLLRFVGDGTILPRSNDATLGIRAMNVPKAQLRIYRVNHRALFQEQVTRGQSSLQGEWGYFNEAWNSRVEVHDQELDVSGKTNAMVELGVPMTEIVEAHGPGAYIVKLDAIDGSGSTYRQASAWRWLYVTDLALASYRTNEAMHVTLRSIETARTRADAKLVLVAQNNEVLAEAQTDSDGHARFPGAALRGTGNLAPKMIMAYAGADDFAALDVTQSPLDLTAFDIAGRDVTGPVDAYMFTERGVYRPGATVHLTALVRGASGEARFDRPGTLRLLKPDATVHTEYEVAPSGMAGAIIRAIDVPRNAPRGRWTAELLLEGSDAPVGEVKFEVQDFVPEQLRLDVRAGDEPLRLSETRDVTIAADFLYGAPGRGLDAEVEARIQVDPKPFPDYANYSFGNPAKAYREQLVPVASGVTDKEGRLEAELQLGGELFQSASPLRAFVTAGVAEPGGRYVRDSVFVPIRSEDIYVGFDPLFQGGYARQRDDADFDIVALDAAGNRIAAEGELRFIREQRDYQWFRENGRWKYRFDTRDEIVSRRKVEIGADKPLRIAQRLRWGQYRIEIEVDGVVSGHRFGSGYRGNANQAAPEQLEIGVDVDQFEPGQTVALTIDAPFAGMAELVVADHTVRRVVNVELEEGSQTLRVKTSRYWNADLYTMVTLYRPGNGEVKATRSVGLVHIPLDRRKQTLSVALQAPEKILPRTTQDIAIQLSGTLNGPVFATLAAVDTGILQITDYSPPDPVAHVFGKRAFSIDIFDDYASMLAPWTGPDRSGGDAPGGAGLSVVPVTIVSLFEGPIEVVNGRAVVPLDVPDFQGELTLMAVAWSESALGSASQPMIVRDPVTVQLALPRFLAPGDKVVATVALDNVDGRDGTYATNVSLDGASIGASSTPLNRGQRAEEQIDIEGGAIGVQRFELASRGPDFRVERDYRIETRAPGMPQTRSRVIKLDPGERATVTPAEELSEFVPNSTELTISAAYSPLFDPAPLLAELVRYPYGCSEQVTSVAVPLLASRDIGRLVGQSNAQRDDAIRAAMDRLLSRQSADGTIGLWRQGDGYASPYLQLYASEFLLMADAAGYDMPKQAKARTLSALRTLSKLENRSSLDLDYNFGMRRRGADYDLRAAERAATAMHLLAQFDTLSKTEAIYLQDRFGDKLRSSMALTRLGAALEAIGERDRANRAYTLAVERLEQETPNYYLSPLSQASAMLALSKDLPDALMGQVTLSLPQTAPRYSNTHERAWMIRAAGAARAGNGDDAPFAGEDGWLAAGRTASLQLSETRELVNRGEAPIWLTVNATGQLRAPQEAASNGATMSKTLHGLDGNVIRTASLARGQRAIILLEAKGRSARDAMWVLADLLPAGFEIETILTDDDAGDTGAYGWLGELSKLDMTEARDDRFVASWRSLGSRSGEVRVAYVVRAVTQGDFAFPGAYLEDMYRPESNAATDAGRLSITPDGAL